MRAIVVLATVLLLMAESPAFAHRVDEYLQATTISVERDRVQAQIRLAPGVAVLPTVIAEIDADRDGTLSGAEQRSYEARVLRDLSLSVDGVRLPLRLVSSSWPSRAELEDGHGEIRLDFDAFVPQGGAERRLTFENHHLRSIAAHLVNGLVPLDPDIRFVSQRRSHDQSIYDMEYRVNKVAAAQPQLVAWSTPTRLGSVAVVMFASLAIFRRRRTEHG